MSYDEKVLDYINSNRDKIISFLQRLVQTESVTGNESAIGTLISEECKKDGLDVDIVEPAKNRLNVVARYHGSIGKPRMMMYSHYDTVPSGNLNEWIHPPFSGEIANGKIWGRGTSDNKVATCSLMMAFRTLKALGIRLRGDIIFTHVADEEKGGKFGFKAIMDRGYGGDVDCLFYAHGGDKEKIGIAANGSRDYYIEVKGKAAHTSNLESGINPIISTTRLIGRLKKLGDEVNLRRYHLPGTNTVMKSRFSINKCVSYVATNVVPDKCELVIDRRFTPAEDAEETKVEIEKILNDLKVEDSSFQAELYADPENWMEVSVSPADSELVRSIQNVADRVIMTKPQPTGGSHSSDHGWFVSKYHKPAASYGIGGEGSHMANENVNIEDLILTTKVYTLLMMDILSVA